MKFYNREKVIVALVEVINGSSFFLIMQRHYYWLDGDALS